MIVNTKTNEFLQSGNGIGLSKTDGIIDVSIYTGTASGTDTYTVTISEFDTFSTLQFVVIKFTNANTGSSTLNINSLGAKTLKKAVSTNLASGDILAGQCLVLIYDGTNFQVMGL